MPYTENRGAIYAALHIVTVTFTLQQWQHLLLATSHTMTNTYVTFYIQ